MRYVVIFLFIFLSYSSIYGTQSWVGIQAGKNNSSIVFDDYAPDKKPGYYFGASFNRSISERLFFTGQVNFSHMNWQYGGITGKDGDYIFSYSINNFQIPVLIRFEFWHTYIEGGGYISYFLNGTVTQETPKLEGKINRDQINTIDLGLSVGCGVKLNTFRIYMRYNYGIQNYYPNHTSTINSIQLGIAFRLVRLQI